MALLDLEAISKAVLGGGALASRLIGPRKWLHRWLNSKRYIGILRLHFALFDGLTLVLAPAPEAAAEGPKRWPE